MMTKEKQTEAIEAAKEYLKGYERAVRKLERIELRIAEMRSRQVSPHVCLDGMPHVFSVKDLSGYAALLDEEERRYLKSRYLCLRKCREITDKIERLSQDEEKAVLLHRYIKLQKWEDICEEMGYSWKHIHRIHTAALKNFKMT